MNEVPMNLMKIWVSLFHILNVIESTNAHLMIKTVLNWDLEWTSSEKLFWDHSKNFFSHDFEYVVLVSLFFFSGEKNQFNGFEDFMYKNIVPACFLAPLKPNFDLSDGQTVIVGYFSHADFQFLLIAKTICWLRFWLEILMHRSVDVKSYSKEPVQDWKRRLKDREEWQHWMMMMTTMMMIDDDDNDDDNF